MLVRLALVLLAAVAAPAAAIAHSFEEKMAILHDIEHKVYKTSQHVAVTDEGSGCTPLSPADIEWTDGRCGLVGAGGRPDTDEADEGSTKRICLQVKCERCVSPRHGGAAAVRTRAVFSLGMCVCVC